MSSIIFPLTQGFKAGLSIYTSMKNADTLLAGCNGFDIAIAQAFQVYEAFSIGNEALSAGGFAKVPLAGSRAFYIAPAILAFFIQREIGSKPIHRSAIFIQESIGNVCQLAALVSSVALIAMGQPAFGIMSATMIVVGCLERKKLLPERISQPLNQYNFILYTSTTLILGDGVEKLLATLTIVDFCYKKYCAYMTPPEKIEAKTQEQKGTLDLPLLQKILNGTVELEINPHHIDLTPLPPIPNVKIQNLMAQFDKIKWSNHMEVVKAKFADDDRFQRFEGEASEFSNEQLIAIVRENLQKYIKAVPIKEGSAAQIQDFDRLEIYLKIITDELHKLNTIAAESKDEVKIRDAEMTTANALLRLAVEGGNYCDPEKYHVAEALHSELAMASEEVPLETKFLLCLQDLRTHYFLTIYSDVYMPNRQSSYLGYLFKRLLNAQDLHSFNLRIKLFGQKMGLRRSGADNDGLVNIDFITKLSVEIFGQGFQKLFDAFYTENKICEHLHDTAGTPLLPKDQLFTWWYNWADRQVFESEEEKEALKEEILDEKMLKTKMAIQNPDAPEVPSRFDIRFLRAMALDMGILRVKMSV